MIFFILDFIRRFTEIKGLSVFTYYSTRMMLAAITSLIVSIFLGPLCIRYLSKLKAGQSIRSDDKIKKETPSMGGILILTAMFISMFLWMDLSHIFTLILFVITLGLGLIGGYDDYLKLRYKNVKGLPGKKKFLLQMLLGGIVALYFLFPMVNQTLQIGDWYAPPQIKENILVQQYATEQIPAQTATILAPVSLKEFASRIYLPFFKDPVLRLTGGMTILAALFIIFVVAGSSNAVNLTDGLDGLATGCLILVASCLALIAFLSNNIDFASYLNILYIEGSGEVAIYLSAFIGACIGFLWYNGHPAQIFMGDTGSLALGGVIGVSAVLLKREFLLGLVGGIFVIEALSVILQVASYRLRNKKRIFLCAPIHHHFEMKGWPETKVVIRFWIIGLLLAIIGLASLKFQ